MSRWPHATALITRAWHKLAARVFPTPEGGDGWFVLLFAVTALAFLVGPARADEQSRAQVEACVSGTSPRITSLPPVKAFPGVPYTYAVIATDPDGDPVTFALPTGPLGMSIDSQSGLVSWTPAANQLGLQEVVVEAHSDSGGLDRQAYQVVVVRANYPPIAVAGADQTVPLSQKAELDGARSRDPEGVPLSFRWTLVTRPAGSIARLIGPTALHPTFTPDVPGSYVVSLVVSDGDIESEPDEVLVQTQNIPPVAAAGPDQVVAIGGLVQLDGSGSTDQDGNSLTYRWAFVQVPLGSNAAINDSTAIAPTFAADVAGTYIVRLIVNDGVVNSPPDQVTIRANRPPIANAGNDQNVSYGSVVHLDGSGSSDPDIDPITYQWSLVQSPAGSAAFLNNSAVVAPTFTADRPGDYVAVLVVDDGVSGTASDSVRVSAVNHAPHITSLARTNAIRGERYLYDVDGTDADPSEVLVYSLQSYPPGMSIDALSGLIEWTPTALGNVNVTARVADRGGLTADQPFTITVSPDTVPPTAHITISPPIANPSQPVTLTVSGADNAGSVTLSLTVNGSNVPLDLNHQAVFSSDSPGVFPAVATATDQSGNSASATDAVRVSDVSDSTGPIALLKLPDDLAQITFLTDIVGTVADDNFYRYELSASPADRDGYFVIGGGFAPVDSGALGTFDPTLLENGLYKVRLVAEDVNGAFAEDERVYQVEGQAKVGVFQIAFIDLQVPVAGIPITMIRSYDSRVKTWQDFGVGWRNDVKRGSVVSNRPPGAGWTIESTPPPGNATCLGGVSELRSHLTEVRLSDRERYTFRLRVVDSGPGLIGEGCAAYARFEFVDGTTQGATLDIIDDLGGVTDRVRVKQQPHAGDLQYSDPSFPDGQIFDPTRFLLTTVDGRKIEFNRSLGGVVRITDQNGNSLQFSESGITHSSGRSIDLVRDGVGRITQITDPSGSALRYEYDFHGDLIATIDALGNRTRYVYDGRHNLLDVVDPLGNRTARIEYDADGRMVAMIDALGNRTAFAHDLGLREEVVLDARGQVTRLHYDSAGFLLSSQRGAEQFTYTHDARGNLLTETDVLGGTRTFTYDASNNLTSETDRLGRRTDYAYTGQQLMHITGPNGTDTDFAYDPNGNLQSIRDDSGSPIHTQTLDAQGNPTSIAALGGTTTITYTPFGQPATIQTPDGSVRSASYDASGRLSTQTLQFALNGAPVSATITVTRDAKGRPLAVVDPLGGVITYTYAASGRVLTVRDALNRTTSNTYDAKGNKTRVVHPDGLYEAFAYDAESRLTSVTDRAGRTTVREYDPNGSLARVIYPDGAIATLQHDAAGRTIAQLDPLGHATRFDYDANGRTLSSINPLNAETRYTYDDNGAVVTRTNPLNAVTTYLNQATSFGVNRPIGVTHPDGSTAGTVWGPSGKPVSVTDELSHQTSFAYDSRTGLTSVTNPIGGTTSYTYDALGNLVSETDALGHVTRHEYDVLGRRTKTLLPSGAAKTFAYDAVGNIVSEVDYDGTALTHTYDSMNRKTSVRHGSDVLNAFTYTATGMVATATSPVGTVSLTYDARDRVTRVVEPSGAEVTYSYDLAGRRTSLGYTIGGQPHTTAYEYDDAGRLVKVVDSSTGTTTHSYDAAGRRIKTVFANADESHLVYDARDRVTSVRHTGTGGVPILASFEYVYDAAGRRTRVTEMGRTLDYAYDNLSRLVSETEQVGVQSHLRGYTYDAVGNRLTATLDGVTTSYAYDVDDRLLTTGGTTYAYDDGGNVIRITVAGQPAPRTFDYDALGMMSESTDPNGIRTTYDYDAFGNRVRFNTGGIATHFVLDRFGLDGLAHVIAETNDAGAIGAEYLYGDRLISRTAGGEVRFVHEDALGSVRSLTASDGSTSDTYAYDAFGVSAGQTGTSTNPYRYAGQRLDPESGLYHMRARQYDPSAARFMSRDPMAGNLLDPRTRHDYTYCMNGPTNATDPTGLFSLGEISIASSIHGILQSFPVQTLLKGSERASEIVERVDRVLEIIAEWPSMPLNKSLSREEMANWTFRGVRTGFGSQDLGEGIVDEAYGVAAEMADVSWELGEDTSFDPLHAIWSYPVIMWMRMLPAVDDKPGHYLSCGFNDFAFRFVKLQGLTYLKKDAKFLKSARRAVGVYAHYVLFMVFIIETGEDIGRGEPPVPPETGHCQ